MRFAAVIVGFVSAACGHAYSCPTLEVTASADGDLELVESRASQADRAAFEDDILDAGLDVDAASTPRIVQSAASLSTSAGVGLVPSCDRIGDTVAPCVRLGPAESLPPPTVLTFRLPDAPGRYALADLAAKICGDAPKSLADETLACWPVTGELVVRTTSAPCKDASCGALDADLIVAPSAGAPSAGAYARGSAHLLCRAQRVDHECSGGGGFPMMGIE